MVFWDSPVSRNNRTMPSTWAIMQSGNLFAYTMNNPIRFIDPSGKFAIPAIPAGVYWILVTLGLVGAGYYAYQNPPNIDSWAGPSPMPDAQFWANQAGGGKINAKPVLQVDTMVGSMVMPRSQTMSREDAEATAIAWRNQGLTPIFRGGSGNATNFTPRSHENALSFFRVMPPGNFSMTTLEAVNATGVFRGVIDGSNHVSVFVVDQTLLSGWQASRPTALENPHPLTILLQSISIRVR